MTKLQNSRSQNPRRALVKRRMLLIILAAPLFFMYSMFVITPYVGGDQEHYRYFYDEVARVELNDIQRFQMAKLGSAEPLFPLFIVPGSFLGIDKDIYVSLWNTALLSLLVLFLVRHRASKFFIALCLLNFYLLVLMTGAERLKFAYLLLLISALASNRIVKLSALLFSPLAHSQNVIHIAAISLLSLHQVRVSRFIPVKNVVFMVAAGVGLALIGIAAQGAFLERALQKVAGYSVSYGGNLVEVVRIGVLAIAGVAVFGRKDVAPFLLVMGFFAIAAFYLGGLRVNMIAVGVFLYLAVLAGKTSHPFILAIMAYFAGAGLMFVGRIISHGDGFFVS